MSNNVWRNEKEEEKWQTRKSINNTKVSAKMLMINKYSKLVTASKVQTYQCATADCEIDDKKCITNKAPMFARAIF